jgi:hypothetical protein
MCLHCQWRQHPIWGFGSAAALMGLGGILLLQQHFAKNQATPEIHSA